LERLRRPIERSLRDADIHLNEIDRIILVGGATRLPVVRHFVEKVFRRAPETLVDPDTAVALGAALQCGMKMRDAEISEVVLTDVCPFTLGTEVVAGNGTFEESGHFLPIIERNTVIPVSRRQRVSTVYDNQTQVMVKILQGESRMAANNLLLGDITVAVPPAPRGGQAIDIIFTYDVNSLLEVEVCVVSTGETHKIVVQNEEHKISDEQAAQRFERLSYLKQNPREDEANRLQLLRGERMYEEATGKRREEIDAAMLSFDRALARQDFYEIEIAREQLRKFLDSLEQ
jgi:molecular chaperone HscC